MDERLGKSFELALPDLSGRVLTLPQDTQGKVVLLDIWATWCEPCRVTLPAYGELARELVDQRFLVVAISIDEDERLLREFLTKTPLDFHVLHDRGGEKTEPLFELRRLPLTLVLDKKGRIRHVQEGAQGHEALRAVIVRLLSEPM